MELPGGSAKWKFGQLGNSTLGNANATSSSNNAQQQSSSRHQQHSHHNRRVFGSFGNSSTSAAISAISSSLSASAATSSSLDVYSAENAKLLEWIKEQLESRGIDSVVYGRHILSMLLMNNSKSSNSNNSNSSSADSSSLSSSESSIEKSSTTAAVESGGDGNDSGYGTSTTISSAPTTTKQKPSLSTTLSSSSSAEKGGRFCDLHQRLYPGLNLHQSRTKLLRESVLGGGKSSGLNTQKPASTTKFMHRRYQPVVMNGGGGTTAGSGRGSPTDHFLSATSDSGQDQPESHCPDCAARNNYGNAAAASSTSRQHSQLQVANVCPSSSAGLDYRKVVLADCLKDVLVDGQDSLLSVDSFVDDLVGRFDRLRMQQQQQGQSNSYLGGGHSKSNYHFSSSSGGKLFGHSKSFEQSENTGARGPGDSSTPWPRLSDSSLNNNPHQNNAPPYQHNSRSGYHNSNQQPHFQQHRSTSFQQSGKSTSSFHRSLSEDNNGGQNVNDQTTGNGASSTTHNTTAISAEKPPQVPQIRDQALKYFAAFPALSGKFGSLSATATSGGSGGRSLSMSRQPSATATALSSISSPLKSSTASLAKMSSAQSSLDDSVFSEDQTTSAGGGGSGASSQSDSWNGLKIIKTISGGKSGVAGVSGAVVSSVSGASSSGDLSGTQLTGGVGASSAVAVAASEKVVSSKPPTLLSGGKSRIIVPAAPSTLLLDSTRESSNFTTLKKKVISGGSSSGSGSGSSSSSSGVGLNNRKSSTTTASSSHQQPSTTASNSVTSESSALQNPKTEVVPSREQEKIFNIMPSYMNPFKSNGGVSSSSTTSTNSSSSVKSSSINSFMTSSRKLPPQSSTASVVSSSGHKVATIASSTSTSIGSRQQQQQYSGTGATFSKQPSLSVRTNSGGRTIVRSSLLQQTASAALTAAASASDNDNSRTTNNISSSTSSTTASSAVDLLPSFLKSHSGFTSAAGNSSRQPPKQQLKSSSAALGGKVEDGGSNTATAFSTAFTCTTAKVSTSRAGTVASKLLNDTTEADATVADDAYQRVIQSAPTTTSTATTALATTRSSQQSSQYLSAAYQHYHQQQKQLHHQHHQQQLQQCEVKPDWRSSTSTAETSFTASFSSSSLSSTATEKATGSSSLTATNAFSDVVDRQQQTLTLSSVTMISTAPPQHSLPHHSQQQAVNRSNLETKTSNTGGSNTGSSTSAGRLLNDYWFNFIEEDHSSASTSVPNKENEEVEVVRTSDDDHYQPSEMVKGGEQQQHLKSTIEEEPTVSSECNQQQQQPPQLVIDSKGALDEWMNSILAAQKLRRGNSVGGKSTSAGEQHHHHHHHQPQPLKTDHSNTEAHLGTFEEHPATTVDAQTSSNGAEGIQDFLDSIRQSISIQQQLLQGDSQPKTSINCWKPLNCNSETAIGSGLERRKPSFDCVSYYWNQNCAPGSFEGSASASNNSNGNKSFRQYLDEQVLHQSEISLIAELFAQSQQQQQQQSSSYFSGHSSSAFQNQLLFGSPEEVLDPLFNSGSTIGPTRRISLANHEAESSAFQEVLLLPPSRTSTSFEDHHLNRPSAAEPKNQTAASISPSGQTTSSSAASVTSSTYFQPIDCPLDEEGAGNQLLTDPTSSDWLALFGAQSSLAFQSSTTTTTSNTIATALMNKSVRALRGHSMSTTTTTAATSGNSSAAASRSISVSRAELETYFTPTTELLSANVVGGEEPTPTTNASVTTTTDFYSASPPVGATDSTTIKDAALTPHNASQLLLSAAVEKLSNSACACKSACGGHFVESACCCVPDEYHCRVEGGGGNGDQSPSLSAADVMRMCDKSTTTSTDHLLDAVKETLLDCLGQQQQSAGATNSIFNHKNSSPARRRLRSVMMDHSTGFFSSFMANSNNTHPFLAASFAGDDNNNGNLTNTTTSKDHLKEDDEEELNVNDLVNSVLRLTTSVEEDTFEGGFGGEQMTKQSSIFQPPSSSLFEVFADHSAALSPIMSFGGDHGDHRDKQQLMKSKKVKMSNGPFFDHFAPSPYFNSPLESFDQKMTTSATTTNNNSNTNAAENKNKNSSLLTDDFDGPPMPYSKRKKLLQQQQQMNGSGDSKIGSEGPAPPPSKYVYGQFPLSGEQMEQLRAMVSQNKTLSSTVSLVNGNTIKHRPSLNSSASTSTSTLSTSRNDLSNGVNTIYYSNRSNLFGSGGNSDSFADLQNHQQSPPLGSSPLFGAGGGVSSLIDVSTGYGDGSHHLAYDEFYETEGAGGKSTEDYVIGPDGAQYYVGGEEGDADQDVDGAGGARSSGGAGGYSAEELYAQYGADAYAVLQHEDLPLNMQNNKGSSASQQPYMFDLKFKTNSRTIDNTIESTVPLKQSQKPCTFYMEGFCARGDCKFSHDLSSITCKYWLEGFCIKEGSCPFLHGYPAENKKQPTQVEHSKLDPNAKSFQFKIESDHDFPALAGDDEDSGLDVDATLAAAFPSLGDSATGVTASSSSLQQLFFNSGSNSNLPSGHRVNFTVAGSLSSKVACGKRVNSKSYASNGSTITTNGHGNATTATAEEEWPSLNGDSSASGGNAAGALVNGNSTTGKSIAEIKFGGYHDRVNFREKVIKSKKSKGSRGGNSSSSGNSTSANTGSSGGSKFALKGLL